MKTEVMHSTWIPAVILGGLSIALLASEGVAAPPPQALQSIHRDCARSVLDQGNPPQCLRASSVPTLGQLYPLGIAFSVDPDGNTSAAGEVESREGGFRFPDGTVQITAAPFGGTAGRIPISQADIPLTISAPGSYVVVEPLSGVSGFDGILITSDDVTLDLNGFSLSGGAGTLDGIRITSSPSRGVLLQNGILRDWGGDGVDAAGGEASEHALTLRDLTVIANTGNGIRAGSVVDVHACRAEANGSIGIQVGGRCVVEGNESRANGSHGIQTENSCSIRDNFVWDHPSGTGIRVIGGATVVLDNLIGQCATGVEVTGSYQCFVARNAANFCTTAFSAPSGVGTVASDPSSALPWGNLKIDP